MLLLLILVSLFMLVYLILSKGNPFVDGSSLHNLPDKFHTLIHCHLISGFMMRLNDIL